MRTVIQRVKHASVTIDGEVKGKIEQGLLILLGVQSDDTQEDIYPSYVFSTTRTAL